MSKILLGYVWGYTYFAPYFINNDPTGLTEEEVREADDFYKKVRKEYGENASIVDMVSDEFKVLGFPEYGGKSGFVVHYTVHHTKEDLHVVGKR